MAAAVPGATVVAAAATRLSVGTFTVKGDAAVATVLSALRLGYRRIDTAAVYRNEAEVAAAVHRAVADGVLACPSEALVTTKLSPRDQHGYAAAVRAIRNSLRELGLLVPSATKLSRPTDAADDSGTVGDVAVPSPAQGTARPPPGDALMIESIRVARPLHCCLLHWPATAKKPVTDAGHVGRRHEAWRALAEAKSAGLCQRIGVSNFRLPHLEALPAPLPDVVQIELHPRCRQADVVAYCRQRGIAVEAYAPFGSGEMLGDAAWERVLPPVTPPPVASSDAAGHSPATLPCRAADALLTWSLQQGFVPVIKSTDPAHLAGNVATTAATRAQGTGERTDALVAAAEAFARTVSAPTGDDTPPADHHYCWYAGDVP